jgi:HAD superfamily hydrolase (TIGR01549 family)
MVKLERVKAVIFDIDGTLYDTEIPLGDIQRGILRDIGLVEYSTYTDIEIGKAVRRDAQPWLNKYMLENNVGPHWEPSNEVWLEFMGRLLSALGVHDNLEKYATAMTQRWNECRVLSNSFLLDGVKSVLEKLSSNGIKLGVITNRYDDPTPVLERDGILNLLRAIEYSNVPGYSKPSPYMLIRVTHVLGVNPLNCACVGDFVAIDMVAANRAGMKPILLTWRNPSQAEKASPDTIVIDHIDEILDLLI